MTDDDEDEQDAFAGWHDQAANDPVFRKWMQVELARREKLAAPTVPPKSASELVDRKYLSRRLDATLELIGKWTAGVLAPLSKRIAALESRQFKFLGVWTEGLQAAAGNACSHDGSMWIALQKTSKKPGRDDSGWQLAVKHGRDGRDARREPR